MIQSFSLSNRGKEVHKTVVCKPGLTQKSSDDPKATATETDHSKIQHG